jgi:hypothetical protein
MNFIGLHTYTTYGFGENKTNNLKEGPEPHVWIGLPGDVNADGTVSWSFPAYYRHTACPDRIWGTATWDTDQFGSGTSQLFDRNEWGSDVFGTTMPAPGNMSAWIQVHNNTGQMLKDAFGHAKTIGVKTCLGTELTNWNRQGRRLLSIGHVLCRILYSRGLQILLIPIRSEMCTQPFLTEL